MPPAQPDGPDKEKRAYFILSFLGSLPLAYYLGRLISGGGMEQWVSRIWPFPIFVLVFWVLYPLARRRPKTVFMLNACFAFLSVVAVFMVFQVLSAVV